MIATTAVLISAVCLVAAVVPRIQPDAIGLAARPNNGGTYSIIGSQFSSITDYPYTAAILNKDNLLLGSGFIYKRRWVITAAFTISQAHKASQVDLRVRLGSDSPFDGGQFFTVSKQFVHPKYQGTWDWDLALLKLNASIKFGEAAKPIKIARTAPKTGRKGTVTGWGTTSASATSQLQNLVVDIFDRKTCNNKWYSTYLLCERVYCAYKSKAGPCGADFGDPLVSNGQAVGIYLGGFGCANDDFPSIYCNLSKFLKWINQTIKKNEGGNEADDDDEDEDEDDDDENDDKETGKDERTRK